MYVDPIKIKGYYLIKDEGDIRLFIALVPKVHDNVFFISWLNNFWNFYGNFWLVY